MKRLLLPLLAALALPTAVNSEEYILCPDFLVTGKKIQNLSKKECYAKTISISTCMKMDTQMIYKNSDEDASAAAFNHYDYVVKYLGLNHAEHGVRYFKGNNYDWYKKYVRSFCDKDLTTYAENYPMKRDMDGKILDWAKMDIEDKKTLTAESEARKFSKYVLYRYLFNKD